MTFLLAFYQWVYRVTGGGGVAPYILSHKGVRFGWIDEGWEEEEDRERETEREGTRELTRWLE